MFYLIIIILKEWIGINIINSFDDWNVYVGSSEGSGASKKIWLTKDNKVALFKYPKIIKYDNESNPVYSKEYVSEKIASVIAKRIGIDCAEIEIGTRNGQIGCISYDKKGKDEILLEGVSLITSKYHDFNVDKLFDEKKKEYYSIKMIEKCLKSIGEFNNIKINFYKMLIFDFIIGNTDRHQSNWGFIFNYNDINKFRFCYLYDNGSSLCSYIDEDAIDRYIGKDKLAFNSLVDTKSRSRIRIDSKLKKEPTHVEVMQYLKKVAKNDIIDYVNYIIYKLDEKWIDSIVNEFPEEMVSKKRKVLLQMFIKEKVNILKRIFDEEE